MTPPKPRKQTPRAASLLIASYPSWRDLPDSPCVKHGPFPDRYPHVWQIRHRSVNCRFVHEVAS